MVVAPARPPDHSISEQHVRLAQMLGQAKGKVSERIMYYRKAPKGAEAGWIITAGTNPERQVGLYAKGYVPLERYGFVNPQDVPVPEWVPADQEHAYRVWGKILMAPGGPEEFPVSQIVEYRWYDPERCPVPGTRFPQLQDVKVQRFWCPECAAMYFHSALPLARHLRSQHEYDRTEIATYGAEAGINFSKELIAGRQAVDEMAYALPPVPDPEPMPQIEMDDVRAAAPRRRREGGL